MKGIISLYAVIVAMFALSTDSLIQTNYIQTLSNPVGAVFVIYLLLNLPGLFLIAGDKSKESFTYYSVHLTLFIYYSVNLAVLFITVFKGFIFPGDIDKGVLSSRVITNLYMSTTSFVVLFVVVYHSISSSCLRKKQ